MNRKWKENDRWLPPVIFLPFSIHYLFTALDHSTTALHVFTSLSKFHNMLWIEEAQQKKNMRQYDMVGVTLEKVVALPNRHGVLETQAAPLTRLHVPGLAERRPSILFKDIMYGSNRSSQF